MTKVQLLKRIAYLEFVQDQLVMELSTVDHLLRSLGFPCGLQSVKHVAQELLENPPLSEEHYNGDELPPDFRVE